MKSDVFVLQYFVQLYVLYPFFSIFNYLKILAIGHFQDNTPPGTVQAPSHQVTSPSFDQSQSDAMNYVVRESEGAQVEEAVMEEGKEVDPLDKFLPPPPKAKCSEELQVRSF